MKENKKTEVITFRTDTEIKEGLEMIAEKNKWSISQVVEALIRNFLVDPHPERITIKFSDLENTCNELKKDEIKAVELITDIRIEEKEEKKILQKVLLFNGIECGGLGCIADYEPIKQMTEEEILNI